MMHNEPVALLNIDDLADRVGGRFQLTALVAKRLREVNAGAPFLVEALPGERTLDTVCREIRDGKIWLEVASEAEVEEVEVEDIDELLDMD
jgi:DNA-directed RNA polymerase omega subunit